MWAQRRRLPRQAPRGRLGAAGRATRRLDVPRLRGPGHEREASEDLRRRAGFARAAGALPRALAIRHVGDRRASTPVRTIECSSSAPRRLVSYVSWPMSRPTRRRARSVGGRWSAPESASRTSGTSSAWAVSHAPCSASRLGCRSTDGMARFRCSDGLGRSSGSFLPWSAGSRLVVASHARTLRHDRLRQVRQTRP